MKRQNFRDDQKGKLLLDLAGAGLRECYPAPNDYEKANLVVREE